LRLSHSVAPQSTKSGYYTCMLEASTTPIRSFSKSAGFFLLLFVALFAASNFLPIQRHLWYDELYTYYLAHSPSLSQVVQRTVAMDLAPPLMHLATRFSDELFGPGIVAFRLPAVLGFFFGSLLLHVSLAKRIGKIWAAVAILAFWSGEFFLYSTEARPYGLLIFFFALGVYSLDHARSGNFRGLGAAGLVVAVAGMLLSHMFGLFSVAPLFASELMRTYKRRQVDWLIWVALVVPLCAGAIYIPILRRFGAAETSPSVTAFSRKLVVFFGKSALALGIPVGLSLLGIWQLRRSQGLGLPQGNIAPASAWEDIALLATLALPPFAINLLFLRTHSAFFDRYCITSGFAICVCCALVLRWAARLTRGADWMCLWIFAGAVIYANVLGPAIQRSLGPVYPKSVEEVMPDLPVVVVSGISFLEVDHYAQGDFLKRVYYVTDADGFAKYAHASSFEGMADLKKIFPIRANVEKFSEFRKAHPHFLILGTPQHSEAWFLKKMMAEETVRKLGDFGSIYRDNSLFEVIVKDQAGT